MTTNPTTYLVSDEDGEPLGVFDIDQVQAQATRLAFDMAEACGDRAKLEAVTARHLTEAGTSGFGYVAAAALSILARQVLDPVLQVTDALHAGGHLGHDMRAGLADAARNARESL